MSAEMQEYLKSLGIDTTPVEDVEAGFKPLKGAYEVVIKKLDRKVGETSYGPQDKWNLGIQIFKTLEGDKGENRWLFKEYNNIAYKATDGSYETKDLDGTRNLIRDLQITSGIALDFNAGDDVVTIIEKNKEKAIGRTLFIRTYPKGLKNKQIITVVKELKVKNPFVGKVEDELPF